MRITPSSYSSTSSTNGDPAVQREVQRVVQVVVQIRAGADDEIHHPALHQLDDAATETGGRHRAGNRERDRRVVLGQQHLVGEYAAGLAETRGVEGLKPFVDQVPDVGAATRAVIADGFAGQMLAARLVWCAGCSMGHGFG